MCGARPVLRRVHDNVPGVLGGQLQVVVGPEFVHDLLRLAHVHVGLWFVELVVNMCGSSFVEVGGVCVCAAGFEVDSSTDACQP